MSYRFEGEDAQQAPCPALCRGVGRRGRKAFSQAFSCCGLPGGAQGRHFWAGNLERGVLGARFYLGPTHCQTAGPFQ